MSNLDRYSTERLTADLTSYSAGDRNAAPYLLKLDTPERRQRATSEAHTLMNLLGFRYSEAVYNAVKDIQLKIANNTEDEELYGERVARQEREREAEYRKLTRGY